MANLTEQWELKRPEWAQKQQECLKERTRVSEWIVNNPWCETLPRSMRVWFCAMRVASIDDAILIVSRTPYFKTPAGVGPAAVRKLKALAGLPLVSEQSITRAIALLKKNGYIVYPKKGTTMNQTNPADPNAPAPGKPDENLTPDEMPELDPHPDFDPGEEPTPAPSPKHKQRSGETP